MSAGIALARSQEAGQPQDRMGQPLRSAGQDYGMTVLRHSTSDVSNLRVGIESPFALGSDYALPPRAVRLLSRHPSVMFLSSSSFLNCQAFQHRESLWLLVLCCSAEATPSKQSQRHNVAGATKPRREPCLKAKHPILRRLHWLQVPRLASEVPTQEPRGGDPHVQGPCTAWPHVPYEGHQHAPRGADRVWPAADREAVRSYEAGGGIGGQQLEEVHQVAKFGEQPPGGPADEASGVRQERQSKFSASNCAGYGHKAQPGDGAAHGGGHHERTGGQRL
mmetsp:Transcript_17981/g.50303  ORF Transcript_17981/g.50303 Transcript_17981/m.50303 type:complete len:278 (+) Transcript_17981:654-1487(+)